MVGFGLLFIVMSGCSGKVKGNIGHMENYRFPPNEAEWIRNGEPIKFEDGSWYPQDGFDILLDSEVFLLGEYREVQFFAQRVDIRPYNMLYTKFGRNKFRVYKRRRR